MSSLTIAENYQYVNNYWDEAHAASLAGDEVALLLYRSNMLGRDLRITNYGGGNTSVKTYEKDPITGEQVPVMWIKGSGGDIGTLTRKGLAGLYHNRLLALRDRYRGLEFEDEMVGLFGYCLFDLESAAPSIDTPLHAFVPHIHVDHLHPDAVIAIAASKDGEAIAREIWGNKVEWVPWQRPGFDLGLKIGECFTRNPEVEVIILGGHGLFTWGATAEECYFNSLNAIEKASAYLNANYGKKRPVFGGAKVQSDAPEVRKSKAAELAPYLRGYCSQFRSMVGHFTDDERVLEFVNSSDLSRLAYLGTSCPDHFLRTKIRPLVLDDMRADMSKEELREYLSTKFEAYRKDYGSYYDRSKRSNSPAMRDPNPVVILYPGVGMFTFAKDKQTARVAAEFYTNAINVMKGAEAVSEYVALPEQEAFDIEYWLLEEAKLMRMPKPKSLSGKVAYVTGGTGGIGRAIAEELMQHGAVAVLADRNELEATEAEVGKSYGKDNVRSVSVDVTNAEAVAESLKQAVLAYGGVDVIINCAGISISKPLEETTMQDWDRLQDILVKGQFLVSQQAVEILRKQEIGGDIVNIASKNALFAGPNNVGYGTAKAAQLHMSRLLAAELGKEKVRVNTVNPDAVLRNSKIWAGDWAEGRAKAYGVSVEELPALYAKRTILNEEILPEDIARAVRVFVDGTLNKSTGNVLNVDGGFAPSFVR
ncbi:bifunctional rhamnulose-1-phosphate aldolase/short-chain dehydrogenase [Telluribacter humicola]|uniref:bifunctional rhamnulose-1-phosphate aldolase/short-chain dehydrogenase n=1 Tax=Telluribacter humicola TaxID=1720261 RepID=UPI001A97C478|nr:bifunctional rhamnulose-1-phosphate aldolase/short-chain dehydrogenase [Telluribacter humicola]